jgi:hypothetical protein
MLEPLQPRPLDSAAKRALRPAPAARRSDAILGGHRTDGLARRCSAHDLFLVSEGLQCGNCLALFPAPLPPSRRLEP